MLFAREAGEDVRIEPSGTCIHGFTPHSEAKVPCQTSFSQTARCELNLLSSYLVETVRTIDIRIKSTVETAQLRGQDPVAVLISPMC